MSKAGDDGGWKHSVAGAVAGSATVMLLHPFDVIKTRLQVQDGHQGQLLGSYKGPIHAIRTIWKQEGWKAFYNGLVPAWIGSGVAWSAYFTAYEAIKKMHAKDLAEGERLAPISHTISAAQAGALVCLFTNPIWLVKTRLQLQNPTLTVRSNVVPDTPVSPSAHSQSLNQPPQPTPSASSSQAHSHLPKGQQSPIGHVSQPSFAGSTIGSTSTSSGSTLGRQYKGFLDALIRIGREEGFKGYYKGLGPSMILQTTHGAIQFTVYEELKLVASRWSQSREVQAGQAGQAGQGGQGSGQAKRIGTLEMSAAAVASKLTASIVTYPTQVVRSRLQQRFDLGRTRQYHNAREVVLLTLRGEGVRGLYKGLGPALMRVLPQSALTLLVYENVLYFLQSDSN